MRYQSPPASGTELVEAYFYLVYSVTYQSDCLGKGFQGVMTLYDYSRLSLNDMSKKADVLLITTLNSGITKIVFYRMRLPYHKTRAPRALCPPQRPEKYGGQSQHQDSQGTYALNEHEIQIKHCLLNLQRGTPSKTTTRLSFEVLSRMSLMEFICDMTGGPSARGRAERVRQCADFLRVVPT